MSDNANDTLSSIAAASMQKCVEKLSRISAGVWSVVGADVSIGTLDAAIKRHGSDDGASVAVYFDVKGDLPFVAMILLDPRDIDRISRCFLGSAFSAPPVMNQPGELLLAELGNIILNSFVGALSNTLNRTFMPSAPRCLKGEPQYLLEAMGAVMDLKQNYSIVSIELAIKCDKNVTRSEVLGLIPDKLAQELLPV